MNLLMENKEEKKKKKKGEKENMLLTIQLGNVFLYFSCTTMAMHGYP